MALIVIWVCGVYAQTGDVTHVHDPCIIKSSGFYYLFSTGDEIALRRSANLNSWAFMGSVFDEIPAWGIQEIPGVSNIWAPDIFFYKEIYYLYYSLSTFGSNRSCIGLATNTTLNPSLPDFKWEDQGKVYESRPGVNNFNAIDPNIIRNNDGRIWMSFGSFWGGIKLVELDSITLKPPPNSQLFSIAYRPGSNAIEAPFIVYKNGYYYLFVSFDFCCQGVNSTYTIMVGRSSNITGIYKSKNGISMKSGSGTLLLSGSERWQGPGHCAVLMEDDADWLVYHAYDANNNGIPTLRISQLYWDADGWPTLEEPNFVNEEDGVSVPTQYTLDQNHPNPFNPETVIRYQLMDKSNVRLEIFDLLGRKIKTLINDNQSKGYYTVHWNGSDEAGNSVSGGTYIYRIRVLNVSQTFTTSKKMLLLK